MATAQQPRARPALPLTGGCSCRAIRYAIDTFPALLYACHCTQCQRQTGGAFALNMPVATASLRLTEGVPKAWRRPSLAGDTFITSWFCADCGARLYGERASRPERIIVRAGTLDDTSWLAPVAHMFMANAQPWERGPDTAICYDAAPDDYLPMQQRWRQLWQQP